LYIHLLFAAIVIGLICLFVSLTLSPVVKVLVLGTSGVLLFPLLWCSSSKQENEFLADYSSFLQLTASHLRAGLAPIQALEEAINLLSPEAPLSGSVKRLHAEITNSDNYSSAIRTFIKSSKSPEVSLFGLALPIAIEHGGRFAPALERLAILSHDRVTFMQSAHAATANMRLTAHILLVVSPLIVLSLAVRTSNYWLLLTTHPTASALGMAGIGLICASYISLIWLSLFKP
jgi:Flp pilus assembly protein TadB